MRFYTRMGEVVVVEVGSPSAPGRRARIFGFEVAQLGDFFCLEQVNPFWATYLHVPDFEIL